MEEDFQFVKSRCAVFLKSLNFSASTQQTLFLNVIAEIPCETNNLRDLAGCYCY